MFQTKNENKNRLSKVVALLLSLMLVASAALVLGACNGQAQSESSNNSNGAQVEQEAVQLQIFAANSLERALPEVQALYTEQNPHVTFKDTQFKGSGDLVTELQGGAPADILITASASTMNTAVENGSIDEATRIDLFANDLIVVKQEGSNVNASSLADVNSSAITKVAIGDADAVPAGAYANQSLFTVGLYSDESGKGGTYTQGFDAKVIIQSSVGNVAKTVSTGDVQIGFVYSSDLYRYDGIEQLFVVPSNTHKPIVYPGAVVANSANANEAAKFLDFCLNNPEALKIWAQYGFELI
ncbi:MAG: molybdate ABC transporter substrate-binding protein [Coriobacteriia bacterium]|nr:molybdate ABC transporter substrate-binding protein [Coriobacteriia bacterium]MCL2749748.1 molybdate ABC transporter substrate-binding protein [Coriobacteriia bacterium]